MKWIGANETISPSVATFEDDIYFFDLTTTSETSVLVIDSTGKISKSTSLAGDLTSIVAGAGMTGTNLSGPSPTLNVIAGAGITVNANDIATAPAQPHVTSLGNLITTLGIAGDRTPEDVGDINPDGLMLHVDTSTLRNIHNAPSSTNAAMNSVTLEGPTLTALNAITTTDAATLYIKGPPVAGTNQTLTNSYALWVDDGVVRFDGAIMSGGTEVINSSGILQTTATSATALATSRNFQVDLGSTSTAGFTGAANCTPGVTGTLAIGNGGTGATASTGWLNSNVTSVSGSSGTVTSIGNLTGDVTSVNRATTLAATQPNIESIGTAGDLLSILSDTLYMNNTSAGKPQVSLLNSENSSAGCGILMKSVRGTGVAGQAGDALGSVQFQGNDAGGNSTLYAYIVGEIDVATEGEESGRIDFQIANHDAGLGSGLKIQGGDEDNEIDVTVGLGTESVVTIPGTINQEGCYTAVATSDGSGTGAIPDDQTVIAVDNDGDVNNIITLPNISDQNRYREIRLYNTYGYELRTYNPSGTYLNGAAGVDYESAIPTQKWVCCVPMSMNLWACTQTSTAGVQSPVEVPAA